MGRCRSVAVQGGAFIGHCGYVLYGGYGDCNFIMCMVGKVGMKGVVWVWRALWVMCMILTV